VIRRVAGRVERWRQRPRLRERGAVRSLYEWHDGRRMWLASDRYLEREIIETGSFEPSGTAVVRRLVKPGDVVFDVGANVGYYTVLMAKLVGEGGRVVAFEPTAHYRSVLERNVQVNELTNVVVLPHGLSSTVTSARAHIGESSATLHWVADSEPSASEDVLLRPLDDVVSGLGIARLDFIKIDVDGHEPAILQGAWNTLARFDPVVFFEVSHENYLEYGVTAWDFYDMLVARGYRLHSERDLHEYESKRAFLRECGNFDRSANVVMRRRSLFV